MLPKTLGVGAILVLAACASIIHGSRQQVSISSTPSNARVTVNGQPQGATPVVVRLKRKDLHTVRLELEGYQPVEIPLRRKVSGWVWGNIVFGGLIGLAVDAGTGAMYKLTPEQVVTTLPAAVGTLRTDALYVVLVDTPDREWEHVWALTPEYRSRGLP
jgi:hypothetical protein